MRILDIYQKPLYTLYQWDVNQFVNVVGINPDMPVSVQFWRAGQAEAFVVESAVSGNTVTAAIPNELLREPGELVIYIWQDTGMGEQKGGRTEEYFNIPIKERAQPSDYIYDDNVEYITVKTAIEDAQKATEAATAAAQLASDTAEDIKKRADSGEFDGEKGDKGDKGDTGQTPDILINATVNNTIGTPSVSIEKTGTLENPVFNLSFENLKGEQGLQGERGEQGVAGVNGADGKSATITIGTVTTVSPDTPASVTNTGTETDAIFNFEIPKGADGSGGGADIETLEKIAIKTTIEGNPAMSGSSAEWRIPLIEGYGKSTQVTTTGVNLLKMKDNFFTVINGVSIAVKNGAIEMSGTASSFGGRNTPLSEMIVLKPGTYFLSGKISTVYINKSDNSLIASTNKTFELEGDTLVYVSVNVETEKTYSERFYLMLNQGSTALPYEPYTGGAPSPSPDYPQEIKSSVVTGIKITDGAEQEQSIPLSLPVTLRGIPSETGNVTIDGTKYLSDTIDKEKVTRHIGYIESYNGEGVSDLWMSTTGQLTIGATVIYALTEPTTEPLPAEDVQALTNLKTFYPTSIIGWETEDGAGAWTRAEIIHDPTNYIDEKLAEITAQQTALQAEVLKIGGTK